MANVAVDTVRFHERRGLLAPPAMSTSGYRDYSRLGVDRLRFAKQLQSLGFTLDEIADVLAYVDRGAATCAAERRRFESDRHRVDTTLSELRAMRKRRAQLLEGCAAGARDVLER